MVVSAGKAPIAPSRRFHALDGLRGAAALLVVFFHSNWLNHFTALQFFRNGYLAVDLFFMLSGVVIASNYSTRIRTAGEIYGFLRLRFFRLYPLHAVVLAGFVLLEIVKAIAENKFGAAVGAERAFSGPNSVSALGANVLLVQAWHVLPTFSYNAPSWSISCEVAAYILFAVLTAMGVWQHRWFYALGALSAIVCYVALAGTPHLMDSTFDWGLLRCWGAFMLGVIICRFEPGVRLTSSAPVHSVVQVVATIAIAVVMSTQTGVMTICTIPLYFVLIASLQSERGVVATAFAGRAFQLLGQLSYSIYMVHSLLLVSLVIVATRLLKVPFTNTLATVNSSWPHNVWMGDAMIVGVVILVLLVAAVTYRFVEEPGRLYGRKHRAR